MLMLMLFTAAGVSTARYTTLLGPAEAGTGTAVDTWWQCGLTHWGGTCGSGGNPLSSLHTVSYGDVLAYQPCFLRERAPPALTWPLQREAG